MRERNINVWLPLTRPLLGTWPTTQSCALTGNWTSDPLVCRPALNPLSYTSRAGKNLLVHVYFCLLLTLLQMSPIVFPLSCSPQSLPSPPPGLHRTVVCVHGPCIHAYMLSGWSLPVPSPPCFPLIAVSLFPVSMPLVLFCQFILFVRFHMSEIIWYLSFSDWLIWLSIMFSRSNHAVAKW